MDTTERFLTEKETSKLTGRARQTLRNDRFNRRGLPYVKWPDGQVRYRLSDVMSFMEQLRVDPAVAGPDPKTGSGQDAGGVRHGRETERDG